MALKVWLSFLPGCKNSITCNDTKIWSGGLRRSTILWSDLFRLNMFEHYLHLCASIRSIFKLVPPLLSLFCMNLCEVQRNKQNILFLVTVFVTMLQGIWELLEPLMRVKWGWAIQTRHVCFLLVAAVQSSIVARSTRRNPNRCLSDPKKNMAHIKKLMYNSIFC